MDTHHTEALYRLQASNGVGVSLHQLLEGHSLHVKVTGDLKSYQNTILSQ